MNGAEILVQALKDQGVTTIFGYPGGAMLEIYDAIDASDIRNILVRHEQGAAHEASGYAKASGKVGVCMATSGPGATNLVTGIATAHMDSVPIVAITGQVAKKLIGTDAFQETDITGITNPITKANILVKDANDLSRVVAEAFHVARSGRPGPVLIDIPRDVSQQIAEYVPHHKVSIRSYNPTLYGHTGMIRKATKLIAKAENMVILVGGGVVNSGATEEVKELVRKKDCAVVSTMMGLGGYPNADPHFLGMLGTYGCLNANKAVQTADLILALGTRLDDRIINAPHLFAQNATIIHVDVDPAEIGKNIKPDIPIVGDVKNVLLQIDESMMKENEVISCQLSEDYPEPADCLRLAPQILSMISQMVDPEHTIFTTDVGQHQVWAANNLHLEKPGQFITSGGLGTMGYGLPAAVGAQVARPDDLVIAVTGDGSFQMGMPELGTILEQELPIKILLFNNRALGMVRQLQYHYLEQNYVNVDFGPSVDFAKLVDAYGFKSFKIERMDEAKDILKKALAEPGCVLIECTVPIDDKCLPIALAGKPIDSMYDA